MAVLGLPDSVTYIAKAVPTVGDSRITFTDVPDNRRREVSLRIKALTTGGVGPVFANNGEAGEDKVNVFEIAKAVSLSSK